MATKSSKKYITYFYVILTIIGCVLACSTLISNDYIKLVVVMCSFMVGLYGIMKSLSSSETSDEADNSPAGK